jgi:hypothetical protein
MRQRSHTKLRKSFRLLARTGLAILICLGSVTLTRAQKKPAALGPNAPLSPDSKSYYQEVADAYKTDVAPGGNSSKALIDRNRLIYLAIDEMDLNFYDFQKHTREKRAFFQTVLDVLEIGASTAISITNGTRAKTLIAEGLGAVQAGRTSINKNFALKDTQILFNKMVAKRADILATILTKSVQDVEQYPFEASLIDLINYFKAGTFDGAMENLNIDTGAEANEATKRVERIKIATKAQLDASIVLRATLANLFTKIDKDKPEDAVKKAARDKLRAGLKAVPELLDGLTPDAVDQLTDPELDQVYRKVRQKLVDDRDKIQKLVDALK